MQEEIKTKIQHYFVDENNLIQGEYKDYYDNDQLYIHTFYLNDQRHGEYKRYFFNGNLWEHTFYQNGKRHGEYKFFHQNGGLRHATFYYQGSNLMVNPDTLTEKDKTYILLSGRLPPREQ